MKTLNLMCTGCGHSYALGRSAHVLTNENMMEQFMAKTVLESETGSLDNRSTPDLVAALERPWSTLDPTTARVQTANLEKIASHIATGQSRWWKCRNCNTVQVYELVETSSGTDTDSADSMVAEKPGQLGALFAGVIAGGASSVMAHILRGMTENTGVLGLFVAVMFIAMVAYTRGIGRLVALGAFFVAAYTIHIVWGYFGIPSLFRTN